MTTNIGPVTELVRIPLAVSFESFLTTFTSQLEPVLLEQDGILSILTGMMVSTDELRGAYAVSITQWESMEAHAAFLDSAAAKPFFETLEPLAEGPPAIEHYHLGRLTSAALQSRFAHVSLFDSRARLSSQRKALERHIQSQDGLKRTGVSGSCIEVKEQSALVLFSEGNDFETAELVDGVVVSFVVRLERAQQKAMNPKGTSANL
ncbi:hypothetical protein J7T55_005392 [Diaporthe amygdali]|uniref:uncharacterized protein n=1 Tax=Phomopsis amygdali TaxID=1214568 RepID=UPI0022FDD388|nr:uncharacterized protein J7T55_005392 [Diaporthe amygdali]KAJ0108415.1 hypothetical protein J7T55_005392 [Diaporthe amygdali]